MKVKGPLVTLGVVAVFGIGLMLVNFSNESEQTPSSKAAAPAPAASASSSAQPSTNPVPPPAEQFPAKADYAGKIQTQAGVMTVEITVEGDKAIAYACDGKKVESWLRGSANDGVVSLDNKDKTSHLDGKLTGGQVGGSLKIEQEQWNFTADAARPPAGLYRYLENGTQNSWIIDQNNTVTGVQRRPDGSTSPAVSLNLDGTAVIDGKTVTATRVEGNSPPAA
jgi:hypothetical protein